MEPNLMTSLRTVQSARAPRMALMEVVPRLSGSGLAVMMKLKSILFYAVAAACLLITGGAAYANPYFDAPPYKMGQVFSDDLHKSCKDFRISENGVLEANCIRVTKRNNLRGFVETTVKPVRTSINLDRHIGDPVGRGGRRSGSKPLLAWDYSGFTNHCGSMSVTPNASGVTLYVSFCRFAFKKKGGGYIYPTEDVSIELNDGIKTRRPDGALVRR